MLDYKKLDKEFTELLSKYTKEDLQNWLDFDKQREMLDKLLNGETITFYSPEFNAQRVDLVDNKQISMLAGNYQWAMAA